jgi:hypothetical protein
VSPYQWSCGASDSQVWNIAVISMPPPQPPAPRAGASANAMYVGRIARFALVHSGPSRHCLEYQESGNAYYPQVWSCSDARMSSQTWLVSDAGGGSVYLRPTANTAM